MAWTSSLDVSVGDATKETDYDNLVANVEWLQSLLDAEHDFDTSTGDGSHKSLTFASGASLSWDSGDVTLTHAQDKLTLSGADNGLLISGAAQGGTTTWADDQSTLGGTIILRDTGTSNNDGGMALFGSSGGSAEYFAGIKGAQTSSTNRGLGDLDFATRSGNNDQLLTRRLKLADDGGLFAYNLLAASASTDLNINGSNEIHSVTSSAFYKDDISDLAIDSSLVYSLRPRSYTHGAGKTLPSGWPEADASYQDHGLIAEEVEEVIPELVTYRCEMVDGEPVPGTERPFSIKNAMLPVLLLAEVQKLNARIAALEA